MAILNFETAAGRLGVVRRTLERLIESGEGPAVTYISERKRGIAEADFEKWLESRKHESRPRRNKTPAALAAPETVAAE